MDDSKNEFKSIILSFVFLMIVYIHDVLYIELLLWSGKN